MGQRLTESERQYLHVATNKTVSMVTVPNKLVALQRYSAVSAVRTGWNARVPFWY